MIIDYSKQVGHAVHIVPGFRVCCYTRPNKRVISGVVLRVVLGFGYHTRKVYFTGKSNVSQYRVIDDECTEWAIPAIDIIKATSESLEELLTHPHELIRKLALVCRG